MNHAEVNSAALLIASYALRLFLLQGRWGSGSVWLRMTLIYMLNTIDMGLISADNVDIRNGKKEWIGSRKLL